MALVDELGAAILIMYQLVPVGRGLGIEDAALDLGANERLIRFMAQAQSVIRAIMEPVAGPQYWPFLLQQSGIHRGPLLRLGHEADQPLVSTQVQGGFPDTPASPHRFFTSSRTGKAYVIANILDGPVYAQTPRYPLCIAEFDTDRLCVIRDSVVVIQDLPEGAPKSRRYTNFDMYEERGSGNLILTMPEQPKKVDFEDMTRAEDFEADCIQWRVRFVD